MAPWLNDCSPRKRRCQIAMQAIPPVTALLDNGRCEPLKAGVHSAVMLLAGVCAAYNIAAWLRRRELHLAVNAIIYTTTVWWERCHVAHHLAACAAPEAESQEPSPGLSDAA